MKIRTAKIWLALSAFLVCGGLALTPSCRRPVFAAPVRATVQQSRGYQISSADARQLRIIRSRAPLYNQPGAHAKRVGTAVAGQTVHLNWEASGRHLPTYYQVGRLGQTLGWLQARSLRYSTTFKLPYQYTSQFWPSAANDACETAALKMALSTKGRALNVSLRTLTARVPHSNNPERGYTGNPFRYGSHATIYPAALSRVARQYGVQAKSITGATKNALIYDVRHGDPVVFEGSYKMRNTSSDHSLVLLGYKPGYFFFADPFSRTKGYEPTGWVNTRQFMRIFNAPLRGSRAMVVY